MVSEESDVSILVYHKYWDGLNMSLDLLRQLADIPTAWAPEIRRGDSGPNTLYGSLYLSVATIQQSKTCWQPSPETLGCLDGQGRGLSPAARGRSARLPWR